MPIVLICGEHCRACVLLAAIGAQETLEEHCKRYERAKLAGPSAVRGYEKDRHVLAMRRNGAERKLREGEHQVWERWRRMPAAEREAVKAALADPP